MLDLRKVGGEGMKPGELIRMTGDYDDAEQISHRTDDVWAHTDNWINYTPGDTAIMLAYGIGLVSPDDILCKYPNRGEFQDFSAILLNGIIVWVIRSEFEACEDG